MRIINIGSVDDIAAMVAPVTAPNAAYITGANLTVDGGFTGCSVVRAGQSFYLFFKLERVSL